MNTLERFTLATEMNPLEIIESVRALTVEYKKADALCDILEHGRKVALAEGIKKEEDLVLLSDDESLGRGGVTRNDLEMRARRGEHYKAHLSDLYEARQVLAKTEAAYFAARNRWDLLKMLVKFVGDEAYATRQGLTDDNSNAHRSGDGDNVDEEIAAMGQDIRFHGGGY